MIFIIGGKYQGKTNYALTQYGEKLKICDLTSENIAKMYEADLIKNIQDGVRVLLAEGYSPWQYFQENIDRFEQKILLGTEIGCGIVPLLEEERSWRDETGRVYQLLAGRAQKVVRVWAGIPVIIKED
ncbi:MAG: bifunctional adenosylcobinamide kinase/adenosylcobinamide-phosphate guanylyltransferase [Desulfitobacteriia bacterium]|jgi:adenosylcobinamide kinase/adenosylcobinamide-phosphate guanylyltransferase